MEPIQQKRVFLFRSVLNKQYNPYTEVETNIMIAIYSMGKKLERYSGNTLFVYLSKIYRTPSKKNLLATIRKLKKKEMIEVTSKGAGLKIHLRIKGVNYLMELENNFRRVRFTT